MIKDYFGLASGCSNIVQDCCKLECAFIAMGTITLNHIVIHKVHHLIFNNKCHYRFELRLCIYMLYKDPKQLTKNLNFANHRHTISFTML